MEKKLTIVRDISLLNEIANAGHIKLHPQTGKMITGLNSDEKFVCYYIDDYVNAPRFRYKNIEYEVIYVSGCFMPFLYKIIKPTLNSRRQK